MTAKLDYLNDGDPVTTGDLGVGGLWLMPVAQSPSYHGHDVIDDRTVEADYGTNEDFRTFVDAAHERGIDVIVDLVMNHTSSEHPWFEDARTPGSAHDDWYVWATENLAWLGPDGRVAWHKLDDRSFYGVFWEGMPDLNLRNAAVTAELEDIARSGCPTWALTGSGWTRPSTWSRMARSRRTPPRPSPGWRGSTRRGRRQNRAACWWARSGTRPRSPDGASPAAWTSPSTSA
jgi:hypothetical protein